MRLAVNVFVRVAEQPLVDRVANKVDFGEKPSDQAVCELLGWEVLNDFSHAVGMNAAFVE